MKPGFISSARLQLLALVLAALQGCGGGSATPDVDLPPAPAPTSPVLAAVEAGAVRDDPAVYAVELDR